MEVVVTEQYIKIPGSVCRKIAQSPEITVTGIFIQRRGCFAADNEVFHGTCFGINLHEIGWVGNNYVRSIIIVLPYCIQLARLREIELSVPAGAAEMDIVISRRYVLTGQWQALYDEVKAYREACGAARLKTILATGELGSIANIGKASMVCMMAGADYIKTSTGMEAVNATLPVSLTMVRMIREFHDMTGQRVGFKPAGGVSSAKIALSYLTLIKEELGDDWLDPYYFRFGASSLLGDIERQLEHQLTGHYAASNHHALA